MLFEADRSQFFRPLTSKYRAVVVECLRLLYQRLYSASADYGESLRRDQILEIFEEALARAPILESDEDEKDTRFKTEREQAGWILNLLLEHGWMEKQVDQATSVSYTIKGSWDDPKMRFNRLFESEKSLRDSVNEKEEVLPPDKPSVGSTDKKQ